MGHHFWLGKRGWEGWQGLGGEYHCFQREWRGEQWSLTEFKGGIKENWLPMRKIDRIIRNVMEGSGKLNCDNQNTPTLHTPPTPTSTNFSMSCTSLSNTSSIISRTWVTPQVFRTWIFGLITHSWGGGGYHCFQREWRGEQWSLTEFKGGIKENWLPIRKIDRIIRNVMEGSGKLYCDNQNTPTLHTPPSHLH